jgi:hypothetical protein
VPAKKCHQYDITCSQFGDNVLDKLPIRAHNSITSPESSILLFKMVIGKYEGALDEVQLYGRVLTIKERLAVTDPTSRE